MLFTTTKKCNGGASCNVSSPYDESNSGANPLTAPKSEHKTPAQASQEPHPQTKGDISI